MYREQKPATTLSVLRVFAGDMLLVLGLMVLAEVVLRVAAPQQVHRLLRGVYEVTDDGFQFKAGTTAICNIGFGDREVSINSWHCRDREYGPKQPGEWRILCIGDSFSANEALNVEDIWPNVLEAQLAEAYPGRTFSVVNAGKDGWNLWRYHDYISRMLPVIDADVVVVAMSMGSDAVTEVRRPKPQAYEIWHGLAVHRNLTLSRRAQFAVWYANEMLECYSHLYVALRKATYLPGIWTGITKVPRFHPSCTDAEYAGSLVEPTAELVRMTKARCAEHGAPLVLVGVPRSYECIPAAGELKIQLERADVTTLDLGRPSRLLARVAAEAGVPLYDPAEDLASTPGRTYLPIFEHWNELGNQVVATGLGRLLAAEGLLGE